MLQHIRGSVVDAPVLLGESSQMIALRSEIVAAARTDAKVLILGETGVGKEVVARLIHEQSSRRGRAFIAVNCSGIPETLLESELFGHTRGSFTGAYRDKRGLVQQADRGTLFLDELGEMSLRMQAVLLRFTETGEVQQVGADTPSGRTNVRLITATNRDLRQRIADGKFRDDLYYRLNVVQIQIPPLRARGSDILLLFNHYLECAAATHGLRVPALAIDAEQALAAYAWPGNVRELRNITERLVLQDRLEPLTADDLPREVLGVRTVAAPASASMVRARAGSTVTASPAIVNGGSAIADRLFERMRLGEDFWTVVRQAFKARELTRADLTAIVDRGLRETRGSYRALLTLFHLPATDYKRFHAFLYQQQCNLPVAPYRKLQGRGETGAADGLAGRSSAASSAAVA